MQFDRLKRRDFITLFGGVAVWPLAARAQRGESLRRIGVLIPATADDADFQARVGAFLQGLQQLGWTIGQNVRIDTRWATTNPADIRRHAAELVALAPDVILVNAVAATLALRAPALRAATALTRPNLSAQRLPCGRHAVPTAMTLGPDHVVANHCVEHRDHLTHHCHDHDLRLLSGSREPIVKSLEPWIPIARAQGRHVEHIANRRAATPNATHSFELAAVEVVRRNTNERSDLRTAELTELGQERNQGARQYGADPRHRREQSIVLSERGIAQHDLDQALVDFGDVGSKTRDAAPRKTLQ